MSRKSITRKTSFIVDEYLRPKEEGSDISAVLKSSDQLHELPYVSRGGYASRTNKKTIGPTITRKNRIDTDSPQQRRRFLNIVLSGSSIRVASQEPERKSERVG